MDTSLITLATASDDPNNDSMPGFLGSGAGVVFSIAYIISVSFLVAASRLRWYNRLAYKIA